MKAEALAERVGPRFVDVVLARDEVTVLVERGQLVDALAWLDAEPDLRFGFLSSITATDWPGQDPRFWLAYELRSTEHRHRQRPRTARPPAGIVKFPLLEERMFALCCERSSNSR